MACYCKEVPLDKKADIEQERPRNLYEDDEEGDEYSEPYMTELVNTVHIEDDTKLCGSVPSLPEVAIPNDKCESKIEIPWLKISLAPPGYYQIKNKEGHPNKVVCDCWALSTGDDVYTESLEKKPEKFAEASGPNVCTCQNPKAVKEEAAKGTMSKENRQKKDELKLNLSNHFEESSSPLTEDASPPLAAEKSLKSKPPLPTTEELSVKADDIATENLLDSSSDSSSSIPSDCNCFQKTDECPDIMGKPTDFVYDNPCYGQHETYMDPIYRNFPEDCDTQCSSGIEMPWDDLTVPRNIKLKALKKSKRRQKSSNFNETEDCDKQIAGERKKDVFCGNGNETCDGILANASVDDENPEDK